MENEHRQSDERKFFFKTLVGANHFCQRLCGLRLVRDEGVVVHDLDNLGVAREEFVLEVEDMRMRRDVAQAFENGERKIGRRDLVSKTLADQTSEFSRVLQCIEARDDTARAVTEQKCGQSGFTFFRKRHHGYDVVDIVRKLLHVEALTVRMSSAAQIQRVDGETARGELFCGPCIVAAMGIEAGNHRDHPADLSGRRQNRTKILRPPTSTLRSLVLVEACVIGLLSETGTTI